MADIYMKIDGIKDESEDDKHKDQIEVQSYSHSVDLPISNVVSSSGSATASRCVHSDFTIQKYMDISTPTLNQYCSSGKPIKEIVMTLRRAGETQQPYTIYTMTDCVVSNIAVSGGGSDLPMESVSFNYGKIVWEYKKLDRETGQAKGDAVGNWNARKNKID